MRSRYDDIKTQYPEGHLTFYRSYCESWLSGDLYANYSMSKKGEYAGGHFKFMASLIKYLTRDFRATCHRFLMLHWDSFFVILFDCDLTLCLLITTIFFINPLSPHDALKHHFTSLKTDLIFLQSRVLEQKFPWIYQWFTNTWLFSFIFKPHQIISSTTSRELRQQFAACSGWRCQW